MDCRKLAFSWRCNFVVLPKCAYNLVENLLFAEHLNSWFTCSHENHENWYPTNNNEFTVFHNYWFQHQFHLSWHFFYQISSTNVHVVLMSNMECLFPVPIYFRKRFNCVICSWLFGLFYGITIWKSLQCCPVVVHKLFSTWNKLEDLSLNPACSRCASLLID